MRNMSESYTRFQLSSVKKSRMCYLHFIHGDRDEVNDKEDVQRGFDTEEDALEALSAGLPFIIVLCLVVI